MFPTSCFRAKFLILLFGDGLPKSNGREELQPLSAFMLISCEDFGQKMEVFSKCYKNLFLMVTNFNCTLEGFSIPS